MNNTSAVGALALGLALAVGFALAAATDHSIRWATDDPAFCAGRCHTSIEREHAHHREVSCQSCHASTAATTLGLALRQIAGLEGAGGHGAVTPAGCANCHAQGSFAAMNGHRAHASMDGTRASLPPKGGGPGRGSRVATASCLSCHREHDPAPAAAGCASCHEPARLHAESTPAEADACTSCHAFAASASSPVAACSSCHVKDRALHGGVDCRGCHNPHRDEHATVTARAADCARCHQVVAADAPGPAGHRVCEGCHQPHGPKGEASVSCAACHAEQARARGTTTTALEHDDCASCHRPHDWVAPRAGCAQCHGELASSLLEKSPEAHGRCTSCHAPHGPPPDGATCTGCHENKAGHAAGAPAGHDRCTSCHAPHAAKESAAARCAGCHAQPSSALVASGISGHARAGCAGCHTPHGDPRARPAACASCHAGETKLAAAGPEPHQRCASCHQPHAFAIADPARACAGCHQTLVAVGGSHRGDCRSCHAPHGSPAVASSQCVSCHREVDPRPLAHSKHERCSSCHAPHQQAENATGACARCHERQIAVAASWPQGSVHAGACASCHQHHDVRATGACGSCHVDEARAAKRDAHRCTQCHAPHQPPPKESAGWWPRCSGCHSAQASAVASRGESHGRCASCHAPHGVAPKGCKSCHDVGKLAAHAVPQHQDCNRCHATHAQRSPDRDSCLACHEDMRDHQPTAPRCQACHPFSLGGTP